MRVATPCLVQTCAAITACNHRIKKSIQLVPKRLAQEVNQRRRLLLGYESQYVVQICRAAHTILSEVVTRSAQDADACARRSPPPLFGGCQCAHSLLMGGACAGASAPNWGMAHAVSLEAAGVGITCGM